MKKLFLLLFVTLFSLTTFAQNEISFGIALKYQGKEAQGEWGEWKDVDNPVLVYMDTGFGFIAIKNGYEDRFIMVEMEQVADEEDRKAFEIKCVDKEANKCTLIMEHYRNGSSVLTIQYSDIHYSYLIRQKDQKAGYPYSLFRTNENENDDSEEQNRSTPSTNSYRSL